MQRDAQGVSPTTPGHLHFEAICFDKKIAIRGRHTVYGQPYVVAHVNRPGSARDGDNKIGWTKPDLERTLIEALAGCGYEITALRAQPNGGAK